MMRKMKAYATFAAYLADQRPGNQRVIRALRKFVKAAAPELRESVKWGNGCWIDERGPVAYVYSDADHVQFGFFNGARLRDAKGLLQGKGAYVRHAKVRTSADIDHAAFKELLQEALRRPSAREAAAAGAVKRVRAAASPRSSSRRGGSS